MTAEALRYGIIGTGMMGCEHIRNLALVPGVEVAAIADPDAQSRQWGRLAVGRDVEVYEDWRELLRRARVDAVVVATGARNSPRMADSSRSTLAPRTKVATSSG